MGFGLGDLHPVHTPFAQPSRPRLNPPSKTLLRSLWSVALTTATRSGFVAMTATRTKRGVGATALGKVVVDRAVAAQRD